MRLAFVATALALVAALAGLTLIACLFARLRPPRLLLIAHPVLGLAALICLWVAVVRWPGKHDLPFDAGALVLSLVLVAGALLFSLRVSRVPRPFFAVLIHAAAALFGCALLLIGLAPVLGAG